MPFLFFCFLLVPAAIQGVITGANAKDIKAKLIVEGANGPVTNAATKITADGEVRT